MMLSCFQAIPVARLPPARPVEYNVREDGSSAVCSGKHAAGLNQRLEAHPPPVTAPPLLHCTTRATGKSARRKW